MSAASTGRVRVKTVACDLPSLVSSSVHDTL